MISRHIYTIVLLSIHLAPLYGQPEVNCPPGQVFLSKACEPCPAGTFRVFNTTNTCVKCPAGTFSPIVGVGSKRLCRFCKMNTFSDEGSTRCKKCPEGTVADPGASRCRACGPGFLLYKDRCETCDPGTFNAKNASLECESCPKPLTSPRQATSRSDCRTCPPGQFANSGDCKTCFEGTFKPGRRGSCRLCPPGSVSRQGSVACTQCPAGTVGRLFNERCLPCPEGTTSNGPGATRCRPVGSAKCPSQTFENANGDCERCRVDFRYNKESKKCEPCPSDSLSNGGLQTECTKCPLGQKVEEKSFAGRNCRCPEGMFTSGNTCKPCPRGTYGNFLTEPERFGCLLCSMGTFSNQAGSTRCKPCPSGTFAEKEGAKSCKRCPRGSVPNRVPRFTPDLDIIGSNHCVVIATGCRFGFRPARGNFGKMICRRVPCLIGTPEKDIGIKCLPCEPGSRLVGDKCKKCKIDEVSDGGIITSCTKCKSGMFRRSFDGSTCACGIFPGTGKGIQDGVCKDCPPGSYGSPNFPECKKCKTGSFASGFGNEFCTPCPMGTFADEKGLASCKTCPKGQVPERRIRSRECLPLAKAE